MEKPYLNGTKVDLEPLSMKRVTQAYADWFNDKEVTRYNSHGERVMTRKDIEEYVEKVQDSEAYAVFAIITKDGVHIGNISLQKIDAKNNNAELGIILGEKGYWGKGLASEAARMLLMYGFEMRGFHRIWCGTSVKNIPMQKLALKLGFVEEGIRKEAMLKNGEFVDIIEYGLLQKDFK